MGLLKKILIQNFKCYRRSQTFDLDQSTFFVGINNAGKSAVLKVVHCFFDEEQNFPEYIHKTELRARGAGANRTVIGITFDLTLIGTKILQSKMRNLYGNSVTLIDALVPVFLFSCPADLMVEFFDKALKKK